MTSYHLLVTYHNLSQLIISYGTSLIITNYKLWNLTYDNLSQVIVSYGLYSQIQLFKTFVIFVFCFIFTLFSFFIL